jgi:hypothetical protein
LSLTGINQKILAVIYTKTDKTFFSCLKQMNKNLKIFKFSTDYKYLVNNVAGDVLDDSMLNNQGLGVGGKLFLVHNLTLLLKL